MIIAIDGPAGSGKSTIAKLLAQELKIEYIDSGAIYRTIALHGINSFPEGCQGREQEIAEQIRNDPGMIRISYENHTQVMWLNDEDVSKSIRHPKVTSQVKYIADYPACRELVNSKMRIIARDYPVVIDGRDIGTVVFPDSTHKFFLDAQPKIRAERRAGDLNIKPSGSDFEELIRQMEIRDKNDRERAIAPLKRAEDALYLDTSDMTVEEVIASILNHCHRLND